MRDVDIKSLIGRIPPLWRILIQPDYLLQPPHLSFHSGLDFRELEKEVDSFDDGGFINRKNQATCDPTPGQFYPIEENIEVPMPRQVTPKTYAYIENAVGNDDNNIKFTVPPKSSHNNSSPKAITSGEHVLSPATLSSPSFQLVGEQFLSCIWIILRGK